MKQWLFQTRKEWVEFTKNALRKSVNGIVRLCWVFIGGLLSLLVWTWKSMVRAVGRYPNIALGAFIVVVALVWLLMFARNRATKVGLEAQRDSVACQYQQFKEGHGYE